MNKKQIFCSIRKEWVASLPEEQIRQSFLSHMITEKGFPVGLIAVEKALKQLSNIHSASIPDRRVDIVCFAKANSGSGELYPLLTVECKAVPLSPRTISQVVGYNHFVQARFIALVNQLEMRVGWFDHAKRGYTFIDYLPSYHELKIHGRRR